MRPSNYPSLTSKSLLFIFAILTLMTVPLLGQALTQSEPPLPPDLKITPPAANLPAEIKKFSGVWEGSWRFGSLPNLPPYPPRKAILVVERLDTSAAEIIFSVADYPRLNQQAGWRREKAQISVTDGMTAISFLREATPLRPERTFRFYFDEKGNLQGRSSSSMFAELEMRRRPMP